MQETLEDRRMMTGSVYIDASSSTFTEGGGSTGVFILHYSGDSAGTLSLSSTSFGGTATYNTDYTANTLVLFPSGTGSTSIYLTGIDEGVSEGDESVTLSISSSNLSNGYTVSTSFATATLHDAGASSPTVTVQASDPNAAEPSDTGTYTFTRTGSTASALTVSYSMTGSAQNGTDYSTLGGTVSFSSGSSTATVTLSPSDDSLGEGSETAVLTINSSTAYTIGSTSSATITIADNEPVITVASSDSDASEPGSNTGTYTFTRTGSSMSSLTVNYTMSGSAQNGTDYSTLSGSVTFNSLSTTTTLTLTPTDDLVAEGNETAVLTLNTNTAFTLGSPSSATVTIADNEPTVTVTAEDSNASEPGTNTGTYKFTRTGSTAAAVTVSFTMTGTASGGDYTIASSAVFSANASTTTVILYPVNDTEFEDSETAVLTLNTGTSYFVGSPAYATVTIDDNDLPTVTVSASDSSASEVGLDPGSYTLTRTGSTTSGLTVTYGMTGTATSGSDYIDPSGSAWFASGSSTTTVTLTPKADVEVEDAEAAILTLNSGGSSYNIGSPSSSTVWIADDPVKVSVQATDTSASEVGMDTGTYRLTRTGSTTGSLSVTYSMTGSATKDVDYNGPGTTVTIPAGASSTTITLTPIADTLVEGNETAILTVSDGGTHYSAGSPSSATVTIADDPITVKLATIKERTSEGEEGQDTYGRFELTRLGGASTNITAHLKLSDWPATDTPGVAQPSTDSEHQYDYVLIVGGSTVYPDSYGKFTVTLTTSPLDIYVKALKDNNPNEGNEQVNLEVVNDTSSPHHYSLGTPHSGTVTITEQGRTKGSDESRFCTCSCGRCGTYSVITNLMNGAVSVVQSLANLIYNTPYGQNPIIAVDYSPSSTISTSSHLEATLEFGIEDGSSALTDPITAYYKKDGTSEGVPVNVAIQANAVTPGGSILPSGRYHWKMTVKEAYGSSGSYTYDNEKVYSGYQDIVNNRWSEFGSGWTQKTVDKLKIYGPDNDQGVSPGALLVTGDNSTYWFPLLNNGTYAPALGDVGESRLVLSDDDYILNGQDGSKETFVLVDSGDPDTSTDPLRAAMTEFEDSAGNITSYTYDDKDSDGADDELTKIEDPYGLTLNYLYSGHYVQYVQEEYSEDDKRSIELDYTTVTGGLKLISDVYEYGSSGLDPQDGHDATQVHQVFSYDSETNILVSVGEYQSSSSTLSETSFEYDPSGAVATITDAQSHWVSYDTMRDNGALIYGQTNSLSSPTSWITLVHPDDYTYITKQTDGWTKMRFDPFGNPTEITNIQTEPDPNRLITTLYERDEDGRLTQMTEPDVVEGLDSGTVSYVTTFDYDWRGNTTLITYPDSTTEEWTYDEEFATPVSYVDRLGNLTVYTVDSGTGLITSIQQVVGDQDEVDDGEFVDEDADDTLIKLYYTSASVQPTAPHGLLRRVTDSRDNDTYFSYDTNGNLRYIYYPGDGDPQIENQYDVFNRLTATIDQMGRETTYDYDGRDRLTDTHLADPYADTSVATPGYDDGREAPIIHNAFDRIDRLTQTSLQSSDIFSTYSDLTYMKYVYDHVNNLTQVRISNPEDVSDDSGETVTAFRYDASNRQDKVTDANGNVYFTYYDSLENVASERLPHPTSVGTEDGPLADWNTYDDMGRLIKTVTPRISTSFGYEATENFTTKYYYEDWGRRVIVRQQIVAGDTNEDNWAETRYDYDSNGNLTYVRERVAQSGESFQYKETRYAYNELGTLSMVVEADPSTGLASLTEPSEDSRLTVFRYDKAGNLKLVIDSDHRDATLAQSFAPVLDSELSPENLEEANATEFDYDEMDRVIERRDPDPDGNFSTDDDRPVWQYRYYADGRLSDSIDPLGYFPTEEDTIGRYTHYDYDGLGRLWKVTEPDPNGTSSAPAAPVNTYLYDDVGNLVQYVNSFNFLTVYKYDSQGHLIERDDPDPDGTSGPKSVPVTSYLYDAVGNLLTLQDPDDNVTHWEYNNLNQPTQEENELGKFRSFVYDFWGDVVQKTDRLDRVTKYQYDGLGNQTEERWFDDGDSTRAIQYQFNLAGWMTGVDDHWTSTSGTLGAATGAAYAYLYNARGDLSEEQQQIVGLSTWSSGDDDTITIQHDYDTIGRMVETRYGGTNSTGGLNYTRFGYNTFTYDQLRRLTSIGGENSEGHSSVALANVEKITFEYLVNGAMDRIMRYVSSDTSDPTLQTKYGYDNDGRMDMIRHSVRASGGSLTDVARYDLHWDNNDRIWRVTSSIDGEIDYTYDNDNQLIGVDYADEGQGNEAYAYDANGNRSGDQTHMGSSPDSTETNSSTVTDNNQISTDGVYNYTYDDEGNRTSRTSIATGYKEVYTWDQRDRLSQVTFKDDDNNVIETIKYYYDAFDRLVRRTKDADGAVTTLSGVDSFYAYDGSQVVMQFDELDGTGSDNLDAQSHEYLWGPAVDQLLAEYWVTNPSTGAHATYFPMGDLLGTNRDVTRFDADTGDFVNVEHRLIDAFGNIVADPNDYYNIVFSFTGRMYDMDTKLQNNLHRWYDPYTGKWMSEDPIGFVGGDENLTRYVGNNPINIVDPSGLDGWAIYNYNAPPSLQYHNNPEYREGFERGMAKGGEMGFSLGGIILEPLDWISTGLEIVAEPTDPRSYIGAIPGIPAALGKGLKGLNKAADAAKAIDKAGDLAKGADKVGGSAKAAKELSERAARETSGKTSKAAQSTIKDASDCTNKGAKRGPKTDPNAPHNAKIREEAGKLEDEGNKIVAGGGRKKEELVPTPEGKKEGRRPDIMYETPAGELKGRNVGRTKADGTPVTREVNALDDLNNKGNLPTDFVPYDR